MDETAPRGELHAHDVHPPEGPRDRRRQRPRPRPPAPTGGPRARFVAGPAHTAHLQRPAAGRTGGRRAGEHRDRGGRRLRGRALRAAHHRRVQLPRRPEQRRRAGGHGRRCSGPEGARSQRRRRGRAGRGSALRRHARRGAGRQGRAGRRDLPGRQNPLPALPGLGAGRQDRRPGGSRCRRTRPALAPARAGYGGAGLRPLCRRRHQHAGRPVRPFRRRLHPRPGDGGDRPA